MFWLVPRRTGRIGRPLGLPVNAHRDVYSFRWAFVFSENLI
jgi:hypothetical protein